MGFESFQVELRGDRLRHADAKEVLRKLTNVKVDENSIATKGSSYFLVDDGEHVFEVELTSSPVRVSCRFTLCHPPSVDSAFLDLVHHLMERLIVQVRICDDVEPEHDRTYAIEERDAFRRICSHYVAARRREWIEGFGTEQLAATTRTVHEQIILPQCQGGRVPS